MPNDNASLSRDEPELEYSALEDYLSRRFGLLTVKGHQELLALPDAVKAHSFFSAKVGRAHILERLRSVSDAYSRGETNIAEARAKLTDFLRQNGYIPGGLGDPPPGVSPQTWARRKKISNLASEARLNLILDQNRRMAEAVGEYQRMHDPEVKRFYPCVMYHAVGDDHTRGSHAAYDGKIFDKDDPWLLTHTPPWEFNCRCWLSNIERPDDAKEVQPFGEPTVDSASGYVFRPDLAFAANDMGQLEIADRAVVLDEMTDLVRKRQLEKCTFLGAPPLQRSEGGQPLEGLQQLSDAMSRMQPEAAAFVRQANLNPDNMPDYREQAVAFRKNKVKNYEMIPPAIKNMFPKDGVQLGTLPDALRGALGLTNPVDVRLSTGDANYGIVHNWRHHKEMFTNLRDSAMVLKQTVGNPNARLVFDVARVKGKLRKLIVIHDPDTQAYCVLRLADDGKTAEIVSYHRENNRYGNRQWSKN